MTKKILVYKIHARGLRGLDLETQLMVSTKNRVVFDLVEFDTVTFDVEKEWDYGGTTYLLGKVIDHYYDPSALNLPSLSLTFVGKENYSYLDEDDEEEDEEFDEDFDDEDDEDDESLTETYLLDGSDDACFGSGEQDPIERARQTPSWKKQYDILIAFWEEHPTCIDTLVHIGHIFFAQGKLDRAERFYSIALTIAEGNIPPLFLGALPYDYLGNRPYHRALHGMCLTYWRQGRFDEAMAIAETGYFLNPMDNIGFRFLLGPIKAHESWEEANPEEEEWF